MWRWRRTSEGNLECTMEVEHFLCRPRKTMYNNEEFGNPIQTTECNFLRTGGHAGSTKSRTLVGIEEATHAEGHWQSEPNARFLKILINAMVSCTKKKAGRESKSGGAQGNAAQKCRIGREGQVYHDGQEGRKKT